MNCQQICPFYGRSLDHCDVGAGYISPYHVEIIVRHCTSRYEDCARYRELSEHLLRGNAEESVQPSATDHRFAGMPTGGLLFPLHFDREVMTVLNHEIRTPLTSIRSFSEILLDYPIDDLETRQRFIQIIHEETVRLAQAIDRLFGKADSKASAPASIKPGNDHHRITDLTTEVETSTP